jgi:hypothetical protein
VTSFLESSVARAGYAQTRLVLPLDR